MMAELNDNQDCWEYKFEEERGKLLTGTRALVSKLDSLGKQGWEAVNFQILGGGGYNVLLKRRVIK